MRGTWAEDPAADALICGLAGDVDQMAAQHLEQEVENQQREADHDPPDQIIFTIDIEARGTLGIAAGGQRRARAVDQLDRLPHSRGASG